jgi:hypothetical protein
MKFSKEYIVQSGTDARFRSLSMAPRGVSFAIFGLLSAVCLHAQTAPPTPRTTKGMPPRANPGEYLSRAQAGTVSIGAEFDRHSVPMPESTLSTEDFVVVEVGLFGPAGARLQISSSDFSLRVNGRKSALPVEQFASVFKNLRDPSYQAPELAAAKENKSGGLNAGGANNQSDLGATPPPVHIPPAMERAMSEHVQAAALPEGDRALPVAGLIFFHYNGTDKSVHSVELIYNGPAGKATIALQP